MNNKYGYEDGIIRYVNNMYHLFVSEEVDDPHWVTMKFGYWISNDGWNWTRKSTLYTSSGNSDGTDARAALWAPIVYYNSIDSYWYMTYVSYYSNNQYNNYNGQIWLAISTIQGLNGISGPYKDLGIILQPNNESQSWEGMQGTDSFDAYSLTSSVTTPINSTSWISAATDPNTGGILLPNVPLMSFYGSAKIEELPCSYGVWLVGLAKSDTSTLSGHWSRLTTNPVVVNRNYTENPLVVYLPDNKLYIAVFDYLSSESTGFGFIWSSDGIKWSDAQLVLVPGGVRAPLGVAYNPNGTVSVWYTRKDASGYDSLYYALCNLTF